MNTPSEIDLNKIDARARALRAAYVRQSIQNLIARFRTSGAAAARA